MVGPFALVGYDVLAPLGSGGRTWRAVCLVDGDAVVLRRWARAGAHLDEVRRRAAVWGSAVGGGVVAVRDVVRQGDDLVVVTDLAVGGGLDARVARHGALSTGQVVTLVVGVAETLARAHECGLTHGRVSTGNIVLDADGRPLLTDYVFGGSTDAAADVMTLCELAALPAESQARALADAVRHSAHAEPLLSAPTPIGPDDDDVAARGRDRVAVVVVVVAVVAAVLAGVTWGRHDNAAGSELPRQRAPVATTSPSPTTPTVSWQTVVSAVEAQRARALARASLDELATVEVRGTTLWRHDSRAVSRLTAAGAHLRGLRVRVQSVTALTTNTERAVLRVVDAMSSYDVVDSHWRRERSSTSPCTAVGRARPRA